MSVTGPSLGIAAISDLIRRARPGQGRDPADKQFMSSSTPRPLASARRTAERQNPVYSKDSITVFVGDCLTVLRDLPDLSVHSVVTDPPYAIESKRVDLSAYEGSAANGCEHCNREFDTDGYRLCSDCLDAIRVQHLMASPMLGMQSSNWHEKATHSRGYASNNNYEFQKWCSLWLAECFRVLKPGGHLIAFGGTRTWHRLTTAAEDAGFEIRDSIAWLFGTGFPKSLNVQAEIARQLKAHPHLTSSGQTAEQWAGSGTTLKPSHEPILLARKPLDGTVAENELKHGTGSLNIGACSISDTSHVTRWPTNAMFDIEQSAELDRSAGEPVSRFFWVAKPGSRERAKINGVAPHPTVKPLDLMRELTKLVTKPGQIVLEPFAGSGTTVEACLLEGFQVIAAEQNEDYLPLILHRISRRTEPLTAVRELDPDHTPDLFEDVV